MGPYCQFCQRRCFVPLPVDTPARILAAYGTSTITATCTAGQAFEKSKVGYSHADILRAIHAQEDDAANLEAVMDARYGDLGLPTAPREFEDVLGTGPFLPDDED